ncbi:unnamed protein product [Mytilus coruscus]|uniref:Uncharacterized protein n=1 Tax=Mytilus coruscus TaxID=42192 RepID=A0A6J8DHF4_MYTCO|nr:unnamed protein product [Mytilus coruscus]
MPHKTNCSLVHSGREPGPCKICGTHDHTKRYVHMCQKKDRLPAYYKYVKELHTIEDEDCICRKCDGKLTRDSCLLSDDVTPPAKRRSLEFSDSASNAPDFLDLFQVHVPLSVIVQGYFRSSPTSLRLALRLGTLLGQPLPDSSDVKVTLCEHHYREYQKCVRDINCCICDKSLKYSKKFVNISPDKHDHFNLYITEELNVEKKIESESMIVCLSCYRSYNVFSKSTNFTLIHAQSDGFLVDCLQEFDEIDLKSVDVTNIDLFCFRMILAEVVNKFLTYKPLLLQSLYSEYCGHVSKLCNSLNISLNVESENRIKHDIRWIFRMLKSCLGSALHYWVPESLNTGRMVYRVGTDFMRCAHSQLNGHKKLHFNAQSSKCGQPLHLLLSDVLDKYSGSSTELLAISNRLGATVSKESLKRFISSRCIQLDKEPNLLSSDSFTVASFDNLDKNQKYAIVGTGANKSGFHGTTIQAVTPKPSVKHDFTYVPKPSEPSYSDQSASETSVKSVSRSIPSDLIKALREPGDNIGEPSNIKFLDLAYDCTETEVSEFHSIAVLDETADSKATVELTLNILYDKFQVGTKINYLVVVGDGKSYDILIKLKSEYGNALDWVLPYPGDWHILKNLLPVFIKIYYDAGLKELAVKFHHGATLKKIISVILESADITVSRDCNGNLEGDIQDFKVWSSVLEQKDRFSMMLQGVQVEFDEWRKQSSEQSETFRFWDNFIHVDFMAYLGLYVAIREQNWDLRNAALKNLACLFTAFDRHNYMRMIPYHFADLLTFPLDVIHHFKAGCFAVSLSGDNFFSVALDEAHEMEINLKTKKAINTFSLPSLTAMTYYLPYRAETLHNLKVKLDIESGQSGKRKELSKSYIHSEEQTIFQYVEKLKVSSLFVDDLVGNLHHIFTHTTATSDQADSLLRWFVYCHYSWWFDDDNRDKALGISSLHAGIVEFAQLSANHEEGGCDFVSFFHGCGKKAFLDGFYQNTQFIAGDLNLSTHDETGLCSFYRLVASIKVEKTIKWYTKGCSCKVVVPLIDLSYKKSGLSVGGYCGPGCKCQNCKNIASCQNELPELFDELECFSDVELDACSDIDSDSNSDEGEDEVQIAPSHPSEEFQQYWDTFGILTGELVPDL